MFEVILSPEATDFFGDADRPLAQKLSRCFAQLETNPNHHATSNVFEANSPGFLAIAWAIGA